MIRGFFDRFARHRRPPFGDPAGRASAAAVEPGDFDWAAYLDRYPDLRAAGLSSEGDARSHWLDHGRSEGRWASPLRRPARETLVCPSVDSIYLRASGNLVCWDDAGNDTVLHQPGGDLHYGREVWLGEPYERVRRLLWQGRMPFGETCQNCLVLKTRGVHSSEAVDRRRIRVLQIEPSYKCSLDCPGCVPLSVRRAAPPGNLDSGLLKRILSDFAEAGIAIEAVDFQGHGEPLMHPELWRQTRLVKELFPGTRVSVTTNCQAVLKDRQATECVDEIVCAIDGACESSYARYRVGGSFPVAVRFMRDVAAAARAGRHPTRVVWKYVLFNHNSSADELRRAHAIAVDAGVGELRVVLTRNGPVAAGIRSQRDLPDPPAGLRQTLECHAPDLSDFESRLHDSAAGLAAANSAAAADLALSVARGLHRFYRDPAHLNRQSRRVLDGLLDLEPRLDPPTSALVRGLVDHLAPSDPHPPRTRSCRAAPPTEHRIAATVDLVRRCRRDLAYAPVVTGLRPLYQDDALLYPQFVTAAEGCRLTDTCGRSYLDWMSGYGAVILGYRCREVERAAQAQFACGPVLPFGHPLELEVAQALKRLIPCAEKVGFGKNGSDAVTAAIRIARLVTGRELVLFHGYHGFHDWFAASNPAIGGIPAALGPLIREFPWGDLDALEALLMRHRDEVAVIVMEPAKQLLPEEGYLAGVRDLAHRHGAVLVWDEIVTGFRFAPGGMQELSGVTPDLACFSKAMANGWSISALVGRADLMDRWPQIGVDMTWRAETTSLAAARSVLAILERDHVAARLAATGSKLRAVFDRRAGELGLAARLTGHPSRMNISFDDHGKLRGQRLLEWFIDGCLRRGVVTNGTLLPNAAHDDRAIEETADAFDGALSEIAGATAAGAMVGLGAPRGPRIQGCLDTIEQTEEGLVIGGWLLSEDGFPLTVEIDPQGGSKITAEPGPRPDVALAHPTIIGAQASGWSATLRRADGEGPDREWNFLIRVFRGDRPVFTTQIIHSMTTSRPYLPLILAEGELLETSPEIERS